MAAVDLKLSVLFSIYFYSYFTSDKNDKGYDKGYDSLDITKHASKHFLIGQLVKFFLPIGQKFRSICSVK